MFPWNFCDPGRKSTARLCLIVRKVKWYRQGCLREVREPSRLAEAEVIWHSQVGRKNVTYLKKALKVMSSDAFLRNTQAIDNEWVVG